MARAKLENLVKDNVPSMLDTDVANEVIDVCAAFSSMTISPEGSGSLVINGRKAVLDLTPFQQNQDTDSQLTFKLCIGGVATDVLVDAELA